jgi:uncharacterized protein involved in tolerance to divalent cations
MATERALQQQAKMASQQHYMLPAIRTQPVQHQQHQIITQHTQQQYQRLHEYQQPQIVHQQLLQQQLPVPLILQRGVSCDSVPFQPS